MNGLKLTYMHRYLTPCCPPPWHTRKSTIGQGSVSEESCNKHTILSANRLLPRHGNGENTSAGEVSRETHKNLLNILFA